jgi:hypothetical protein
LKQNQQADLSQLSLASLPMSTLMSMSTLIPKPIPRPHGSPASMHNVNIVVCVQQADIVDSQCRTWAVVCVKTYVAQDESRSETTRTEFLQCLHLSPHHPPPPTLSLRYSTSSHFVRFLLLSGSSSSCEVDPLCSGILSRYQSPEYVIATSCLSFLVFFASGPAALAPAPVEIAVTFRSLLARLPLPIEKDRSCAILTFGAVVLPVVVPVPVPLSCLRMFGGVSRPANVGVAVRLVASEPKLLRSSLVPIPPPFNDGRFPFPPSSGV